MLLSLKMLVQSNKKWWWKFLRIRYRNWNEYMLFRRTKKDYEFPNGYIQYIHQTIEQWTYQNRIPTLKFKLQTTLRKFQSRINKMATKKQE